jgi:hypothetical protein
MRGNELISYFNFDDHIHKDPNSEPYVILAGYETWKSPEFEVIGLYNEFIGYRSFMIKMENRDKAFDELEYSQIAADITGYFEENSAGKTRYITGESWEHSEGLTVEPLHIERHWSGLNISFYEPSQRLIIYLNLIHRGDEWLDPYRNEVVIKRLQKKDCIEDTKHTLEKIEIKIDYLKDYLAARESGLFIAKYTSRRLLFESPDQIPLKEEFKDIPNGTWSFITSVDKPAFTGMFKGKIYCEAEIRQKFWIEPFPEPKRWDAKKRSEFEGGVVFTLSDGTKKEYNVAAGDREDYFKLISFNPRVMEIFLNRLHFDYEEYSRETLGLKFPNGETFHAAINPSGQIQAWWGQIAQLSKEYQELLAPYSEPWLKKLSGDHDYIRTTINGNFPQTKPLKETLQRLKTENNDYFLSKFNETLFNQYSKTEDLKRVYEPYEIDPYQLLDVMEQIDKWLLSEERPDKIISYYSLDAEINNKIDLPKIKSLVALELLLKKYFRKEEAENRTKVLRIIKDLRICKAHYKDLSKTLEKYDLNDKSPREIYKKVISELEDFFIWFSKLTKDNIFE